MHRSRSHIAEELAACIRCNECLAACPALPVRIPIETLNRETLDATISPDVQRFAESCYQCGACVPVCPVGLHRDAMMLWLKMRLLSGDTGNQSGVYRFTAPPLPVAQPQPAPAPVPVASMRAVRVDEAATVLSLGPEATAQWEFDAWMRETGDGDEGQEQQRAERIWRVAPWQ